MNRLTQLTTASLGCLVIATLLPAPASGDDSLRVMAYNVRFASDRQPNAWADRRPVALAMLQKWQPDVIGMQEAVYRQVKDFEAGLQPEFSWIGLGRDGGSQGEFMAVFYRRSRLEPLRFDHFWLSDTPNVVGSSTWGNTNRRMVTWVLFRDKKSGQNFYFWNTHFDHRIQAAREKSAALIVDRVAKLKQDVPIIVAGDFNATAGNNPAYETLVTDGPFFDTWLSARQRGKLVSTFHGYRGASQAGNRIDWILAKGNVMVERSEIVTFEQDGQYPSDHFPVVADILLKE